MSKTFTDINNKNNEQHLKLTDTMRSLVLDHMSKNQDLFMTVVRDNTQALTKFNQS